VFRADPTRRRREQSYELLADNNVNTSRGSGAQVVFGRIVALYNSSSILCQIR
jgi:hypothetical protein